MSRSQPQTSRVTTQNAQASEEMPQASASGVSASGESAPDLNKEHQWDVSIRQQSDPCLTELLQRVSAEDGVWLLELSELLMQNSGELPPEMRLKLVQMICEKKYHPVAVNIACVLELSFTSLKYWIRQYRQIGTITGDSRCLPYNTRQRRQALREQVRDWDASEEPSQAFKQAVISLYFNDHQEVREISCYLGLPLCRFASWIYRSDQHKPGQRKFAATRDISPQDRERLQVLLKTRTKFGKGPAIFPLETRLEVAKMRAEKSYSVPELCDILQISGSSIQNWSRAYKKMKDASESEIRGRLRMKRRPNLSSVGTRIAQLKADLEQLEEYAKLFAKTSGGEKK